jgi:hypothetical protein
MPQHDIWLYCVQVIQLEGRPQQMDNSTVALVEKIKQEE